MVRASKLLRRGERFVAQGFGSGLIPKLPGTAGAALAALVYLALRELGPILYPLAVLAAFVVGIYLCGRVSSELDRHDDPTIVWDEMVGLWCVMIASPGGWLWIAVAFVLFRLFDIVKPWPISWLDRHVGGGLGIMVDDVAAAAASWLVLHLCHQLTLHWGLLA